MRFFIEVGYDGFNYAGFQIQKNAQTIQGILEESLHVIFKTKINLTGSSRTDAQVNAFQNYFHFDYDSLITSKHIYGLNAILPQDVVVKRIVQVNDDAHSRFSATSRKYLYKITRVKDPFSHQKAYYYPYQLETAKLHKAAAIFLSQKNYQSFCKTNTQVNNYLCDIQECSFEISQKQIKFEVKANRFLRGMIKAMVATSLQLATNKITEEYFLQLFDDKITTQAVFSVPGYALYLREVNFPENIFLL